MNGGQTGLRVSWRWIALATLLAWVGAFGLCTAHCALGMGGPSMGNEPMPPCHGGGHSPDSDSEPSGSGSFCFTVKSLSSETFPAVLEAPEAAALFQPVPAWLITSDEISTPVGKATRQGQQRDRAFTPEVSSGPAHLAHGPPIFVEPSA